MNKATTYAQTLHKVSKEKTPAELDVFFTQMIEMLKHKKEYKILPAIYRAYTAMLERDAKTGGTTLVVRDISLVEQYKKELEAHKDVFDLENLEVIEDEKIVGGFIAKNKTALLDNSYRKGLLAMYEKLKG